MARSGSTRRTSRSSTRRVIGGSIARLYLAEQFQTAILSSLIQVGPLKASITLAAWAEQQVARYTQTQRIPAGDIREVEETLRNVSLPTLDADFAREAAALIEATRNEGDSIGALVEVVAVNVPSLVGAPLYNSLKLRLMGALGGVNAARGVEVGAGFGVIEWRGSENNDPIRNSGYQSNHHGGMLGGITTGMPLVCRVAFKPTSSIGKPQESVRKNLDNIDFTLKRGRHDPCVGVRAGVTLESRMAIEVMNAVLMHQANSQHSTANFELFHQH